MKKYIILLLALCSMSACDYEAVNTNPYGVSDGELGPLKYGARFMNMQQRVIPIGSPSLTTGPGNDLQNTDLISSLVTILVILAIIIIGDLIMRLIGILQIVE